MHVVIEGLLGFNARVMYKQSLSMKNEVTFAIAQHRTWCALHNVQVHHIQNLCNLDG